MTLIFVSHTVHKPSPNGQRPLCKTWKVLVEKWGKHFGIEAQAKTFLTGFQLFKKQCKKRQIGFQGIEKPCMAKENS